jgi:aspartate/methionine/tyrosine aminotransferase
LSVFLLLTQRQGHAFQSIIQILNNELGSDVHMVWAVSKDFGSSGLRYGVLYTQNDLLLEALASVSSFTCVSGPIQYLVSELLTDDQFVDNFLEESRERLVYSYAICTRKLEEMVLPFIPAEAGMFVYVDFSSLLPEKTFEWEEKLSEIMFQVRVVLTPGEGQHDTTPGMFRICYAWVSPETLEIAMERLSRLVAKLRRMDWDDINGRALSTVLYG